MSQESGCCGKIPLRSQKTFCLVGRVFEASQGLQYPVSKREDLRVKALRLFEVLPGTHIKYSEGASKACIITLLKSLH